MKYHIKRIGSYSDIERFNAEMGKKLNPGNFFDATSRDYLDAEYYDWALRQLESDGFELINALEVGVFLMTKENQNDEG